MNAFEAARLAARPPGAIWVKCALGAKMSRAGDADKTSDNTDNGGNFVPWNSGITSNKVAPQGTGEEWGLISGGRG